MHANVARSDRTNDGDSTPRTPDVSAVGGPATEAVTWLSPAVLPSEQGIGDLGIRIYSQDLLLEIKRVHVCKPFSDMI